VAEPERRAAVLGRPVAHSLSPVLHRAAYAALGLPWRFDAIECGEDELAVVLGARAGWAGFSCTMPLKRAVLQIADEVHPRAATVGAANTLLPLRGTDCGRDGWRADNTDVAGVATALREAGVHCAGTVAVLGAGGTAQAALVALAGAGVQRCAVLVRDTTRARELRKTADATGIALDVEALDVDADALSADLVISTLPAGASDPLAGAPWRTGQAVLDVVYRPWPTALAATAAAAGATVVSGALMLLHQAAAQVELMTGLPALVEEMRSALRAAAPGCGA
jgi:shikimate dehydrogenase